MNASYFDVSSARKCLEGLNLPIWAAAIVKRPYVFKPDGVLYIHFPEDRKIEIQFSRKDKVSDLKARIGDHKILNDCFHFVSKSGILTDEMDASTLGLRNGDHIIAVRRGARMNSTVNPRKYLSILSLNKKKVITKPVAQTRVSFSSAGYAR